MKNDAVVDILLKLADLVEFHGESPFKVNAYRRAARAVQDLSEDIETVWAEGRLASVPGIGEAICKKIDQFLREGHIKRFAELAAEAPRDLFKLLSIPHFGPKTAAAAYRELGVETLDDLRRVIDDGSLAALPGMGAKKVENIRNGLDLLQNTAGQIPLGMANLLATLVIESLNKKAGALFGRIAPAGSVRRFRETVHDIDIIVESEHGAQVIDAFTSLEGVTQVLGSGSTKGSVIFDDRFQVDLRVVSPACYGAALQYFTGSQAHNVRLRERAKKDGLKINEYGVFRGERKIAGASEEKVYEALGLPWISPELREDRGEIEAALEGRLPNLLSLDDIRGDLHMHTRDSDGRSTLEEMVEAARRLGYGYIAVCNHSKSAFYANGLDEERLARHIEAIRRLNEALSDFTVLAGIEVDILPDGSLDFDDAVLSELDFVVASIHSAFKQDPTGRTIAAMSNRFVDVIGHPTGRLIGRREAFDMDIQQVIEAAARTGTALEVNSSWDRLDLKDVHVRAAIERGVKICVNTDAHQAESLIDMALGVGTARRGWAERGHVINTMPLDELRAWQKRNR